MLFIELSTKWQENQKLHASDILSSKNSIWNNSQVPFVKED